MSLALSHARAELIAQMESDDERASPAAFPTPTQPQPPSLAPTPTPTPTLTPTLTPTPTLALTLTLTRCVAHGLGDDDRCAGGAARVGRGELCCGARRLGAAILVTE